MTFNNTATSVAMTTGLLPNIVVTQAGNWDSEEEASDIPIPSAAESPTIEEFRNPIFSDMTSFMPVMAMEAKTEMVAPPSTQ